MRQSYLNDLSGNTLMTMCESPAMHRGILFCRTLFLCELPAMCRFDFKVWLHLGFGESLKSLYFPAPLHVHIWELRPAEDELPADSDDIVPAGR